MADFRGLSDSCGCLAGCKSLRTRAAVICGQRPFLWAPPRTELPAFLAEIERQFTPEEIGEYLDYLERTKYLAPQEPAFDLDELEEAEDEEWLENPTMGAEELIRFSRIRQLRHR